MGKAIAGDVAQDRLGKFSIAAFFVKECHPAVFEVMAKCIVLSAGRNISADTFEYKAYCADFRKLRLGDQIPTYQVIIKDDRGTASDSLRVKFVEVIDG